MTVLYLVLGFLVPALFGFFLVSLLLPTRSGFGSWVLRLSLSWGVGTGCLSILFFFWMVIFSGGSLLPWVEAVATLALGAVYYRSLGRGPSMTQRQDMAWDEHRAITIMAGGVFMFLLFSAIYVFVVNSAVLPHGRWDAWMIWSLRAKALYYFSDDWHKAFDPSYGWSHAGYPLLLPGSMARVAIHYNKSFSSAIPIFTGFLFTFSVPVLVFSFLYTLRGPTLACVAGAILLSAQMICLQGSSLYADLPLAFFMLAATGSAAMALEGEGDQTGTWALAGLCAGLAAWTKNEGMLFLVVIMTAVMAVSWYKRGFGRAWKRLARMAIGVTAPVITIAAFKIILPAHNYLVSGNTPETVMAKIFDMDRHLFVIVGIIYEIAHYGGVGAAGVPIPAPGLALVFLAAWGASERVWRREVILVMTLTILAMLAGYIMVYIISPMGLHYQFTTTVARLLTHIWPLFVMLVMLAAKGNEGVAARGGDINLLENGVADG